MESAQNQTLELHSKTNEQTLEAAFRSHKNQSPIRQLLSFAGNRRWLIYLGCICSAASMLLSFVPFICIWLVARNLIDVAPNWVQVKDIVMYGWVALGFSILTIVSYFIALMCTHTGAFRCASNLRKATTSHLMDLPLGYFDMHASGELRRIVDGCAKSTETLIAHSLPDTAGSIGMIAGMIILFFIFDWRLGLACCMAIPVYIVCLITMMSGRGREYMSQYMNSIVAMNKTGTEYVRGIPVVKVFQQTVYSFKAFHDAIKEFSRLAVQYSIKFCRVPESIALTILNGLIIFLIPTAILLAPGEVHFNQFVINFAFYAMFSAVIPTAMTRLMFISKSADEANDAIARVSSVLDVKPLPETNHVRKAQGSDVSFDHVMFTYESAEAPALKDVTFNVPAGTTVALVGPSGGGKSTCASLVPRFWDVDAGKVRIGGVDVREMDPHELMNHVAFVFQTNQLFAATLLDNVRAARPDATREEALAALKAAQCDDIVAKLPEGIDTMLGTGSAYLSGGEIQRVALARVILKDAPIVVLDEATAFADPENEVLIQRAFAKLTRSRSGEARTVLMIAHRLSTIKDADMIVVLDRGAVIEKGTHDELLAAQGLYAKMWRDYEHAVSWKVANSEVGKQISTTDAQSSKGGEA